MDEIARSLGVSGGATPPDFVQDVIGSSHGHEKHSAILILTFALRPSSSTDQSSGNGARRDLNPCCQVARSVLVLTSRFASTCRIASLEGGPCLLTYPAY